MAGGTGGHVFPAIAVAQSFAKAWMRIFAGYLRKIEWKLSLYQSMLFLFDLFKFLACVVRA